MTPEDRLLLLETWARSKLSAFIVTRDMDGVSVGAHEDKMGIRCSKTTELVFEDCRIPAKNLLGKENQGFFYIMQNFQGERLVGLDADAFATVVSGLRDAEDARRVGAKVLEAVRQPFRLTAQMGSTRR